MKVTLKLDHSRVSCEVPVDRPFIINYYQETETGKIYNSDPEKFLFAKSIEQAEDVCKNMLVFPKTHYYVIQPEDMETV